MSAELESRLVALEARLRELEDRAAIMQIIATYGPSADACAHETIAGLWTDDGTYEVVGFSSYQGSAGFEALITNQTHLGYVSAGSSHVMAMPHIVIDGDTAVATGYSQVFVRDGQYWRVERASGNRWELVRTAEGWRVKARYNHLMDGSDGSFSILRGATGQAG
jgi:hypothetical protein